MVTPKNLKTFTILMLLCSHPSSLFCQTSTEAKDSSNSSDDFFAPDFTSTATRSDIVMPLGSFLLPGLSQWVDGAYGHGAVYSGVALGGAMYSANARQDMGEASKNDPDSSDIDSKGVAERKYMLGLQTYQSMGGFSLYHSFRSSVTQRKRDGQYTFLKHAEKPSELALAPFHFQYLARPTTWIPLLVGVGINAWIVNNVPEDYEKDSFRKEDAAFATAFSWNAGTHEEAVFRGWMMPVMREYGMNDRWSNIFAAAHLNSTPVPIAQLALGWHLGDVTQRNDWQISESIFIHTWWDILAFTASYHRRKVDSKQQPARLHLPPLKIVF